jgi:hypothetical protein
MAAIIDPVFSSHDALLVRLWKENPNGLVSLRDLVFTLLGSDLAGLWQQLFGLGIGFDLCGDPEAATVPETRYALGKALALCRRAQWTDLSSQASRILARAEQGEHGQTMSTLVEDFRAGLDERLRSLQLLAIEDGDSAIFTNAAEHLCGGKLHGDLAISEEELNLGGKALSVGLSTAAVAHAMRSVEAGLHAFCRALGITFPGTVELQDWANLTEKIKSEIDKLNQQQRGPQKADQLKRMGELLLPADGFRLAWRNHVAHAREKYETHEARLVLRHVAEFLARLSATLL